ncbi:MAG TPA: RodZ domain-containing protein [Burkholderiaceae bacterium]|nr:RodZ domain-containing protein [Burkholderiaceae bacterium]
MTEIEAPRADSDASATQAASFGRRLAAERERLGLSVGEIAGRLRLHPKQVQAIESESLPALPAPFLRGFVRNYAKEVRLDPAPLLAELNARLGPQQGGTQALAPARSGSSLAAPSEHGSRRIVLIGVLVALIVFAVLGGLATRSDKARVEPAPATTKPVAAVAPPAAPAAAVEPKVEPVASLPAETPAPVPAAVAAAPPPAPAELVRMSFHAQSWVEVTQADGRVILSQINEAGTEQRVEGKPPLKVVIGNASGVSLDYKGKPVDLKPSTNPDNVARITLN